MTRVAAGRRVTCLERQPDARRYRPRVLRVHLHDLAGANVSSCAEGPAALGHVEGAPGKEIGALEIERGVRGESPRESQVYLGADVARVALHPALGAHRRSSDGPPARMGAGHARIGVDCLRRPGRIDGGVESERGCEVIGRPEAESGTAVPVVADVATHVGYVLAVGVVDSAGEDRGPPSPVAPIRAEWLIVADRLGEVVTGLVARGVDAARLEEQRAE